MSPSSLGTIGDPWREALADSVGHTFANGVSKMSTREVHRRLGIPPTLKLSASKSIGQAMRSLGWSHCRMGPSGAREWGWARRDYDIESRLDDTVGDRT
jgi:hypothetical protein